MAIGSADVAKAMLATWNSSGLNAIFQAYWSVAERAEFPVIHDEEAGPAQPWPYCVFRTEEPETTGKMSAGPAIPTGRYETRESPWEFRIHGRTIPGKTGKTMASELMEEVCKVFGGHPTVAPTGSPTLDNGNILLVIYKTDFSMRDSETEYTWHIKYVVQTDIPQAA